MAAPETPLLLASIVLSGLLSGVQRSALSTQGSLFKFDFPIHFSLITMSLVRAAESADTAFQELPVMHVGPSL